MGAALASGGTLTYPFAVGEISQNLSEIEGLPQEKADDIAAAGGAISAALETLGIAKLLPRGTSNSILGGIASGVITEGTTEGLQELVNIGSEAVGGKQFSEGEILNRLKEAAAAGSVAGGAFKGSTQAASKAKSLFTSDGNFQNPNDMDPTSAQAAGDFARRLRTIADANSLNLRDVDPSSTKGSREAVDKAHIQLSEELKQRFSDLKGRVKPNDTDTFEGVRDKILTAAAYREGRNKTKSTVGQQEIDALVRLTGDTAEGQETLNLLLQLNQLTELHNEGYKGGVSQFTDNFGILGSGNGYDRARQISQAVLNPTASLGAAVYTGGASIPAQLGVVGAGRAIDKVTGRRSTVDRFVNRNENAPGLQPPSAPSLRDQAILDQQAQQAAEAEAAQRAEAQKEAQRQLNIDLAKRNAPPTPESPQATMELATGLDRSGVARVIRVLQASNQNPALQEAIEGYRKSVAEGGKVNNLSPLIRAVNQAVDENPGLVERVRAPQTFLDQAPGQPRSESSINADFDALAIEKKQLEAQASSIQDEISNLSLEEAQARKQEFAARMAPIQQRLADISSEMDSLGAENQARRSGNQFTTPENYQAGKSDNNSFARSLASQVSEDAGVSVSDKAQLLTALEDVQSSLGPDPVAALDEITTELQNIGVNRDVIDTYFKPYRDRVALQQARVGRMQAPSDQAPAAPTVDQSLVAPTEEPQTYEAALERLTTTNIVAGAVRKITEGNMDPASVEAMLNQLEQNNPGIKAKILDITDPQQQSEDSPRFARIAPVPFNNDRMQQMFGVEDPTPGGNYIDLDTKEDLTGNTYAGGKVSIVDGKPVLDTSDDFSEPATKADGRKVKVNLFKQKAGWKWIDYDGPATIVSTEVGGKHHYALSSDFQNPVTLQTYPNQPSEPRLRPTTQGEVELGNKIGNISVRGKIHPVYDEVRIVSKSPERPQVSTDGPLLSIPDIPRGESTNIQMPNQLGTAFGFAKDSNFAKGRDLKLALQEKSLAAQKEEGVDLTELSTENVSRLADHVVSDALEALKDNSNAIGWYDRTVTDALSSLSEIYPEIQTNPVNKLQFIWALAVTSNGTKVDKNFELAANAYDTLQRTGRFPTNIGIGEAAKAINGGLQQYHTMLEKFERQTNSNEGDHQLLADFMNSQVPVKQIEQEYNVQISGEGKNTLVRGASILGPKIGNGFFSNLYGNFDALTMDRWLMRTVGRMRGSLVKINQPMVKKKNTEIKSLISSADKDTLKSLRSYLKPSGIKIGKTMSQRDINDLAAYIAKQSTSKDWRVGLNGISEDLRKAGNALAKYLDGQVEAPAGAKERDFIRSVFTEALGRLNSEPTVTRASNAGLTMSDLQALLWYPEKRLYDTAKAPKGQESRGYADDEAPDYANAARKLVETRKAMAVGGGLGSTGAAGPGGRGPVDSDARFNREPTGVAGILAQRIQGSPDGPTARGAIPDVQEVKGHVDHARALVEVGKPGSQYENGIKDQQMLEHLAKAVGVTLKMFDDHNAMLDDGGFTGATRKRGEDAGGFYMRKQNIARSLAPGATVIRSGQVVAPFRSYLTALHEVAHGIAGRDIEGNLTQNVNMGKNYLTGNKDAAPIDTLEHMIGNLATMPSAKKNKIIKEIMSLQDNESFNGDGVYYPVRPTGPAKERLKVMSPGSSAKKQLSKDITNFEKYSRSVPEFTVDPLIMYLQDPKKMKKVAPETAKAIRAFFVNSSKIRFYSHPLAMAFAVVMAMLMKQEQAEEEERQKQQQMAPGALTPPPGALTAA
jgi:hypothetical protein